MKHSGGDQRMQEAQETHGDLACEIEADGADGYLGALTYRIFDVGQLDGPNPEAIRVQFRAICKMIDAGGMVRHGIIMLGYHNGACCGDVLMLDGEVIGRWFSDDEDWCHFTEVYAAETSISAPSPWMLHDAIAGWVENRGNEKFR